MAGLPVSVWPAKAATFSIVFVGVQLVGYPSVTNTIAAARPGVDARYWRTYWAAPWSAGRVGVPPLGVVMATAFWIGAAFMGNWAIGTAGVAYVAMLH